MIFIPLVVCQTGIRIFFVLKNVMNWQLLLGEVVVCAIKGDRGRALVNNACYAIVKFDLIRIVNQKSTHNTIIRTHALLPVRHKHFAENFFWECKHIHKCSSTT